VSAENYWAMFAMTSLHVRYYLLLAYGNINEQTVNLELHEERFASGDLYLLGEFNPALIGKTVYAGCDDVKGCFGIPDGCVEQQNCDAVVTYVASEMEVYQFQLQGTNEKYVSVGFSTDGDLGDDSVIVCIDEAESLPTAYYLTEDEEFVAASNGEEVVIADEPSKVDLTPDGASSYLSCTFALPASISLAVDGEEASPGTFSLNDGSYNLTLSIGPVDDGQPGTPTTSGVTPEPVVFKDYNRFLGAGYDGCNTEKGCFGVTSGCVDSRSCSVRSIHCQKVTLGDILF